MALPGIDATKDSYMDAANPTTNYGSLTTFNMTYGGGNDHNAILHFDLSSVASNYRIVKGEIQLYCTVASGAPIRPTSYAYRLTQTAWTETGVTWDKYNGINNWVVGGGDYDAGSQISMGLLPGSVGNWLVDITALVIDAFVLRNKQLHLLLDVGGSFMGFTDVFASLQHATTGWRPKILIEVESKNHIVRARSLTI